MPALPEPWWSELAAFALGGLIFWAGRCYERWRATPVRASRWLRVLAALPLLGAAITAAYEDGVSTGRLAEQFALNQRRAREYAAALRRATVQRQARGWAE